MTAIALTQNGTEIIVGLLATIGIVGAAWVSTGAFRKTKRAAEATKDTLGEKPADDVTVISLLQTVVSGQADLVGRVANHDGTLAEHAEKIAEHDRLHDEHIARLEEHAEILRYLRGDTH